MISENNKLLVVLRHGERMDLAGLVPLFGSLDPELTPTGEQQEFIHTYFDDCFSISSK